MAKNNPVDELPIRIRFWRKRRGLTQRQLCELIGIHPPNLSRIERGECDISLGRLRKISKVLSVPLADLLSLDDGGLSEDERKNVMLCRSSPNFLKKAMDAIASTFDTSSNEY